MSFFIKDVVFLADAMEMKNEHGNLLHLILILAARKSIYTYQDFEVWIFFISNLRKKNIQNFGICNPFYEGLNGNMVKHCNMENIFLMLIGSLA